VPAHRAFASSADAFNLYGLRAQVSRYKQCVELLLGVGDSGT